MEIIKVKSVEEMGKVALKEVLEVMNSKENPVLGLATGSSPVGLYQAMIEDHQKNGTSYKKVRTVNLDEYVGIEPTHSQSYATFMKEQLFNHIDIDLNHVHIPCGNAVNPEEECQKYEQILNENKVDLQILGIGSNGHIAFNEPGTPFNAITQIVTLDEQTRRDNARFFDHLDEVPKYAISMGIQSICRANKILLIAMGKNKAKAVAHMIGGSVTTDCPASILQVHPNVVVIADEEALSDVAIETKPLHVSLDECGVAKCKSKSTGRNPFNEFIFSKTMV